MIPQLQKRNFFHLNAENPEPTSYFFSSDTVATEIIRQKIDREKMVLMLSKISGFSAKASSTCNSLATEHSSVKIQLLILISHRGETKVDTIAMRYLIQVLHFLFVR